MMADVSVSFLLDWTDNKTVLAQDNMVVNGKVELNRQIVVKLITDLIMSAVSAGD